MKDDDMNEQNQVPASIEEHCRVEAALIDPATGQDERRKRTFTAAADELTRLRAENAKLQSRLYAFDAALVVTEDDWKYSRLHASLRSALEGFVARVRARARERAR